MPRVCTVCSHEDRAVIDSTLLTKEPLRGIARRFAVSEDALFRHKKDHISTLLLKAREVEEVARADSLLDQVRGYQDHVDRLTLKAEAAGDFRTALSGLREARGFIELLAKIVGDLDERPQVTLNFDNRVQEAIFAALEPYDAARVSVANVLKELDHDPAHRS